MKLSHIFLFTLSFIFFISGHSEDNNLKDIELFLEKNSSQTFDKDLEKNFHLREINSFIWKTKPKKINIYNSLNKPIKFKFVSFSKQKFIEQVASIPSKKNTTIIFHNNSYMRFFKNIISFSYFFNIKKWKKEEISLSIENTPKNIFPLYMKNPGFLINFRQGSAFVKDIMDNHVFHYWKEKLGIDKENIYKKFDKLFKDNYVNQSKIKISEKNKNYRIPKIFHFIWLTSASKPKELSVKSAQCIYDTMKANPPSEGWKYYLWTNDKKLIPATVLHPLRNINDKLEKFITVKEVKELQNLHGLDKVIDNCIETTQWGRLSDIYRYIICEKYGGIYTDLDFIVLHSLDFYNQNYDLYVGMENDYHLGNAFIAIKPRHPFMKKCLELIKHRFDIQTAPPYMKKFNQNITTIVGTGPVVFTLAFYLSIGLNKNKDIVLPKKLLFPHIDFQYRTNNLERHFVTLKPETLGIHLFEGSWVVGPLL